MDVGHGSCSYLVADNGNLMLFDCGHKTDPEIRPSSHLSALGHSSVERLIISNYDEDHISDLPELLDTLTVSILRRNKSIDQDQLRALKQETGQISGAMDFVFS